MVGLIEGLGLVVVGGESIIQLKDPLSLIKRWKNRSIYIPSCLTGYLSPLMATQKYLYLASLYFWGRKSNPLKCINVVRD